MCINVIYYSFKCTLVLGFNYFSSMKVFSSGVIYAASNFTFLYSDLIIFNILYLCIKLNLVFTNVMMN